MNTCNFKVHIPDWVNWIAQDRAGNWWGFENRPRCTKFGIWGTDDSSNLVHICDGVKNKNWRDELYEWYWVNENKGEFL